MTTGTRMTKTTAELVRELHDFNHHEAAERMQWLADALDAAVANYGEDAEDGE